MSGLQRALVCCGVIAIAAVIDGTISGIVAATWGAWWGNRVDDLALFSVAVSGLWLWTGRCCP